MKRTANATEKQRESCGSEASLEAERMTTLVVTDYLCKMVPMQQLCPYLLQALEMQISGSLALASLLFSEIFLHQQLFPTISSITRKDTQYFSSFRASTALRGEMPSLHCSHLFCWLYFTCKGGSAMPSRCVPCV